MVPHSRSVIRTNIFLMYERGVKGQVDLGATATLRATMIRGWVYVGHNLVEAAA